ncbi:MAG: hypothetical protein KZQ64_03485 [gamma proteobacterium symbiont of Bathyaustriella thionipta]|nr:hypothetical protein [gamma proteobacterium symbiont of Bathyaustriella thionipta]MCU7948448.1 hypothetical protein [gamma proteobacterium symbiont of Bathyaustriella thionipta]MCU7952444.1 hypothetical protein [gamma proteobacterium symbiont of Bathyaustriella thionipta]MCU7955370.1 hypothetical protein [gamma proteobacterium symbiont of Bathyaustriella thionipta]MCU7968330.1 hypothetical protein [gamma proteobacterium symbiont of Bathyaustriella thionipta]
MDISSSIHTTHITHSFSTSHSVVNTEGGFVPATNQQTDSFTFSDKAHSALHTLEPFEDKSLAQTKQYEADIIKSPFAEGKEPLAGEEPLANNEPSANKAFLDDKKSADESAPESKKSLFNEALSEDELLEVEELKRRDTEVRAHEQAHMSAAGNLAQGGANFSFETGPDGKRYAVGGDVSIDTSPVTGDPQATLRKAQQIRRAASAPVDPSSQDRSVAAQAARMEAQARVEISQQVRAKQTEYIDQNTPEIDFLGPQNERNEQNIQDTYTKIQNSSVLQEQRSFIDFFI